jgi:hypothetical protein
MILRVVILAVVLSAAVVYSFLSARRGFGQTSQRSHATRHRPRSAEASVRHPDFAESSPPDAS